MGFKDKNLFFKAHAQFFLKLPVANVELIFVRVECHVALIITVVRVPYTYRSEPRSERYREVKDFISRGFRTCFGAKAFVYSIFSAY